MPVGAPAWVVSGVVVTARSKGTLSQPVGEKAGVLVVVTTFVTGSRVCLTSVDSLTVLSGVWYEIASILIVAGLHDVGLRKKGTAPGNGATQG